MALDAKTIGLAAKDILVGIGTAAAGASGGPAAAEGVGKAGSGLDRLLSMAGVTESRADKFDRADFAARPQGQKDVAPREQPPLAMAAPAPPAVETAAHSAAAEPVPKAGPYTGDTRIAADHLRSLGWEHSKIQQILSGPEHTSLAALVGKDTKGFRARGAAGTLLPQVAGTPISPTTGGAVAQVDGQIVPSVRGQPRKNTGSEGA